MQGSPSVGAAIAPVLETRGYTRIHVVSLTRAVLRDAQAISGNFYIYLLQPFPPAGIAGPDQKSILSLEVLSMPTKTIVLKSCCPLSGLVTAQTLYFDLLLLFLVTQTHQLISLDFPLPLSSASAACSSQLRSDNEQISLQASQHWG